MTDPAPDYAAPLLAWRAWNLLRSDDGWRLGSIHYRETWGVDEPVEAWCYRSSRTSGIAHDRHAAPARGCHCGIYGAGDLDVARDYLIPDHVGWEAVTGGSRYVHRVVGLVRLWGRVVECENGFRAERAYPERLWVPTLAPDGRPVDVGAAALDLLAYGVPVELLDAGSRDAILGALQPSSTA